MVFEQIWDNYYGPHLKERALTKGEIMRAKGIFLQACVHGELQCRSARELVMLADKAIQPYIKARHRSSCEKCDFCGRPHIDESSQCPGCGVWRKQYR